MKMNAGPLVCLLFFSLNIILPEILGLQGFVMLIFSASIIVPQSHNKQTGVYSFSEAEVFRRTQNDYHPSKITLKYLYISPNSSLSSIFRSSSHQCVIKLSSVHSLLVVCPRGGGHAAVGVQ